jgi:hypothetical protein
MAGRSTAHTASEVGLGALIRILSVRKATPSEKFHGLLNEMPVARRKKIAKRVERALAAMPLDEVRRARQMTQVALAQALGVNQGEVSKIEHRTDVYLRTLVSYVEALGGRLEIPSSQIARCESVSLKACRSKELTSLFRAAASPCGRHISHLASKVQDEPQSAIDFRQAGL